MIRGTTPTHYFNLPFEASLLKSVRVTYVQNGEIVFKKETEDCILEGSQVIVRLTQADTLKFDWQASVQVQLRVLTTHGEALSTKMKTITVGQCLDGEELK